MTIPLKPSVLIDDKVGGLRMPDDGEELEPGMFTLDREPFPGTFRNTLDGAKPITLEAIREGVRELKALDARPLFPSPGPIAWAPAVIDRVNAALGEGPYALARGRAAPSRKGEP